MVSSHYAFRGIDLVVSEVGLSETTRLEIRFQSNAIDIRIPEKAEIKLHGSLDKIVSAMDELAWLAAVLRPLTSTGLKSSSTQFQLYLNPEIPKTQFSLCLNPLEDEIENKNLSPNKKSAVCWHPLFKDGVIASGFHIAKHIERASI